MDGVTYVNDSKATNVDSAAKALGAFKKIRWICGGLEKEGGVEALANAVDEVLKAYVIGREASRFAMQLAGVKTEVCTSMEEAVARAMEMRARAKRCCWPLRRRVLISMIVSRNAVSISHSWCWVNWPNETHPIEE